uniref:Uncharacterized protein n=1 Tax=Arundo donax TaxID=35708 RepID=A0A0A9DXX2_ARUDO
MPEREQNRTGKYIPDWFQVRSWVVNDKSTNSPGQIYSMYSISKCPHPFQSILLSD